MGSTVLGQKFLFIFLSYICVWCVSMCCTYVCCVCMYVLYICVLHMYVCICCMCVLCLCLCVVYVCGVCACCTMCMYMGADNAHTYLVVETRSQHQLSSLLLSTPPLESGSLAVLGACRFHSAGWPGALGSACFCLSVLGL